MTLQVLDISNAFQNSVIFDPEERVYLSLPLFYLDWFHRQWPVYKLPSLDPSKLALQCLKSIQGTCDAGRRWYHLLFGHFRDLGMLRSSIDHGIFLWQWNDETCYLALETDDILFGSSTRAPFLHLKQVLESSILRFLNLCIIQSPQGVYMDQTQHIKNKILHEYFQDVPLSSIQKTYYPFPLDSSFEQVLYEAPPLIGRDLQVKEKECRFSVSHILGTLMHVANISRPDLAYACMRYSSYMVTPNAPILNALHLTMCYLHHHPHLPIMYPSKQFSPTGNALQSFWDTGKAEYLSPEFGDELTTFTDADHACCLRTRQSTSVYFILFNGVVVSWSCKKQIQTALHSTGSEITALHHGAFKTVLLRSFLQSIGIYLNTPTPTYEDNQGTIKLVRTHRLTDTVRHYAVKIAWLNENFNNDQLKLAYTKTSMMLCDCSTKPSNGSKLFDQISYAIGQRFYPTPDKQHFHDLQLDTYSYL